MLPPLHSNKRGSPVLDLCFPISAPSLSHIEKLELSRPPLCAQQPPLSTNGGGAGEQSMSVRIIATGGHSGLGFEALKTLLASPALAAGCSVTLMVRDEQAPPVTLARRKLIEQYNAARPAATTSSVPRLSVDTLSMDLSSLPSVRKAAAAIQTQLQTDVEPASGQDIFLLNAAVAKSSRETVIDADRASGSVSYPSDRLVSDDSHIETSACVNHIAHLVFISSLVPTITANAKKGRKTRIVFTGSALHRSVKDLSVLDSYFSSSSHDSSSPWTLRETYAASKFLQMLGVRALRHRIEASLKAAAVPSDRVEVVVVQPGFVPQTGLSRAILVGHPRHRAKERLCLLSWQLLQRCQHCRHC